MAADLARYVEEMNPYLFIFGYETPEVAAYNRELGTDDEDSQAVFLQGDNQENAILFGKKLANMFFSRLYEDSDLDNCVENYANWIEEEPTRLFSADALSQLPVINVGDLTAAETIVSEWIDNE